MIGLIQRLREDVLDIKSRLSRLFPVGIVDSTDPSAGRVVVRLPDRGDQLSGRLPVLFAKTHRDKEFWLPDPGTPVQCLFLPFCGLEVGVVLGALYTAKNPPPQGAGRDVWIKEFEDGTVLEYDRAGHRLSGYVAGDVELYTDGALSAYAGGDVDLESGTIIRLTAPAIIFTGGGSVNGDLTLNGSLNVTGDIDAGGHIFAGGLNSNHHSHPE